MWKKNKGLFIALGVLVIIIVGGLGAFFIASSHKATSTQFTPGSADNNNQNGSVAPTLSPDDIGLTLALATSGQSAGHAIDMKITKIDGIQSIDYEFTYTYSGSLNEGGFGHLDVKPGDTSLSQQIVLGTCSSGVCRYDANVSSFKVTLKISKTDGKSYESSKEINL